MRTRVGISMGEVAGTVFVLLFFLAATQPANAAQESARVTQVIKDVKLLGGNGARSAAVNDDVRQGTAVRTGQDSRTELTFTDKTLTRLGANSIFSFEAGGRAFDLGQGSILMQVPPNGSSVKVKTAAVTAAITGGTAIFGVGPPVKFMVLEGTGTFYPTGHPEEAVTLHGGEMVTFTPDGHIVGPTEFNVKLVLETSGLIVDFPDLANLPLIWDVIRGQEAAFSSEPSNPPPKDTTAIVDQKSAASAPSATPGKFGPLSTISSPNPYVINSGTHIQTDPSITTNGVTDFGKIYRGQATDGPFSAYAFGSTSSFDTTSGFDAQIQNGGAVFKFQSLQLTGDPTVTTTNGETSLALIGVDGITSGGPGGTLTFAGINGLLFATQNGSINLGSEISFTGSGDLNFYARGSGSNLTLASPITGYQNLRLYSEGSTQINGNESATNFRSFSGGDFLAGTGSVTATNIDIQSLANINIGATLTSEILNINGAGDVNIGLTTPATLNAITMSLSAVHDLNWSGQTSHKTATNSDGNVTISAGHAINILGALDILRKNGGRTNGLNLSLDAIGGDLTAANSLVLAVDNSVTGNLTTGANITLHAGGQLTAPNGIELNVLNGGGGHIGTGGNVDFTVDGAVTAQHLQLYVDSSAGGMITHGGDLNLLIGGTLMLDGPLGLEVDNYQGGTITTGGNITAHFVGDVTDTMGNFHSLNFFVINGAGFFGSFGPGNIGTGGNINVTFDGNVSTTGTSTSGGFYAQIQNGGGTIGTGGDISMTIGGNVMSGPLTAIIENQSGHIVAGGNITYHVAGDVTTAGRGVFEVLNNGGTIGSDVVVDIRAHSFSIGTFLIGDIDDTNGSIGGNATIDLKADSLSVTNALTVVVYNGAGHITGNAHVGIDLSGTGSGAFTPQNGAYLQILNGDQTGNIAGGTIGGDATINLLGSDITPTGLFEMFIGNQGGHISGKASIDAQVGNLSPQSAAYFQIWNNEDSLLHGGGTIGGDATINVHAFANILAGANLLVGEIDNRGGHITGNATIDFNAGSGGAYTQGSGYYQIFNNRNGDSAGGTIGGNAGISLNGSAISSQTGPLVAEIDNKGGSIGGNANLTITTSSGLLSTDAVLFRIVNSGGTIASEASITINTGDISTSGDFNAYIDNRNGSINGGTSDGSVTIAVTGSIGVGSRLNVLGDVTATGHIFAPTISSTNLTSDVSINAAYFITRFAFSDGEMPDVLHTLSAPIVTAGAGINFNGVAAVGDSTHATNGGDLTINALSLSFGPASNIVGPVSFNGGDGSSTFGAGSGGTFIVNTTGDITANNGADITATTGLNTGAGVYSGAGGSVTLHSSGGMVTVDDRIEVSSDDGPAQRQSASGGTILLQSDLTTGPGITVGANAKLLSLLNANAPGPGGSITLSTMGADITVNGTIEADRGTITIDQTDPVMAMPRITIDGATLISDTLNVNSIGDLRIADTTPTTLTFSTATLHADRYVSWNVAQSTLPASINSLHVTAGNGLTLFGGNSDVAATLTLNMQNPSTLTAGLGGINAQFTDIFYSGGELNLMSGGNITAHSIKFTDSIARGTVNATGSISTTGDLWEGDITAGTSINVGRGIIAGPIIAGTTITAGQYISASSLTAGGDITADNTRVQYITSPTGVLHVASGISPLVFSTSPGFPQGAVAQHTYNVDSIVSPIGIDFSGNQFDGIAGFSSGGLLTINATTITFDSSTGIGSANFNGADVNGFSNGTTPTTAGDGGTFIVNTTGDITTVIGSDITATTGLNAASFSLAFAGAGGTVELNSSAGSVTVDSTIQVSSADLPSVDIAMPFRSSAKGGNIKLTSGKTTGVAINIGSSSQLLALLNAAAPGPGGKITITAGTASGNSSSINIDNLNGQIVADKGLVQIEHDGDGGSISINNANIRADTIKVGALGSNGTLTIGGGSISADSILKLYASGSNGQLNFIANVTLSSGTAMHLAANTITIQPSVLVTINGLGGPANVYTNNPNYSGFGGTNLSNGTFGGNGALIPKPLNDPSQPGF